MNPQTHGIVVEAEVHNCAVELYINDIPAGLCGIGISQKATIPINEYLIDGTNTLSVLINPGDTPDTVLLPSHESKAAYGAQPPDSPLMDIYLEKETEEKKDESGESSDANVSGSPAPQPGRRKWTMADVNYDVEGLAALPNSRLSAKVCQYPVGVPVGESKGEVLMSLSWNTEDVFEELRKEEKPFPRWTKIERDLGPMFGPMHWQKASSLKLDEKTIEQVKELMLQIQEWIEEGEADPIIAMSVERFKEVAAAYALPAEERKNMFHRLLREESVKDYWIFETPEDEDFSFRLVAGGKMIECLGKDWQPIIRGVPDPEEGRFMYPMMIGKLKGDWLIMR